MKKMNKIFNIAVISMIGAGAMVSEIAQASDEMRLRVPLTRDVDRDRKIIIEIKKKTIKGRLAKLDIIKNRKQEDIKEYDINYLMEIEDYFNLGGHKHGYNSYRMEAPYYAGALYILCQAELDSLESQDKYFPRNSLSMLEAVDIGNLRHEIAHIINTQDTIYWARLLDYRGVQLLKPKILYFLINRLIVFIKESEEISRFAEGRLMQFSAIITVLEELKEGLTAHEYNRLVDINENLRTMFSMYALDLQLDPQPLYFMGNPVKLFYIWMNLYRNAEEAFADSIGVKDVHSEQFHIKIRTAAIRRGDKDLIEIVFSDNGPGIPDEMLKNRRLFAKGETSKITGTGMGLYIVEQVVKEYGGTIEARNIPGGGAEFTIILPSAKALVFNEAIQSVRQEANVFMQSMSPIMANVRGMIQSLKPEEKLSEDTRTMLEILDKEVMKAAPLIKIDLFDKPLIYNMYMLFSHYVGNDFSSIAYIARTAVDTNRLEPKNIEDMKKCFLAMETVITGFLLLPDDRIEYVLQNYGKAIYHYPMGMFSSIEEIKALQRALSSSPHQTLAEKLQHITQPTDL